MMADKVLSLVTILFLIAVWGWGIYKIFQINREAEKNMKKLDEWYQKEMERLEEQKGENNE